MCTGSRSGLCKQGKPHLTPYLKGGSHPAPCLRAHSKNPQSLSNTGVAQTSPHSAPLCQHAQTSIDSFCSCIPAEALQMSSLTPGSLPDVGSDENFIHHFTSSSGWHGHLSNSVLNHADYNEQFQAVLSRYHDMISYHVITQLYISLLLMACFDLNPKYLCFVSTTQYKESLHEAGFIFWNVCLIFLWQGTKDGCIYWVTLCPTCPTPVGTRLP